MVRKGHVGRVAVVTGAAAGIGRAIAERLAQEGAAVVIADVADASEVAGAVLADGARSSAVRCDVTDEGQVTDLAAHVEETYGSADILVNNAGVYRNCSIEDLTLADWRSLMATNVESVFLVTRAFVPGFKARRYGRIVNVASNTFHAGVFPDYSHYIASKGAVIGFTRALASELGPSGITVNAIAPGLIENETTLSMRPDEMFEEVRRQQAIPRRGGSSDLAGAVSFLADEDSSWITGQTLVVDGGLARA